MESTIQNKNGIKLPDYGPYTIQVRTPSPNLSPFVYEFALTKFSKSLDIAEKTPGKGTIEIIFSSETESTYTGVSTTTASARNYGAGWYTGNTFYNSSATQMNATTISSGSIFTWQNSTLMLVVRDAEGRRLYSVDYKYKGAWELSGLVVNTPEEAARLCIERVYEQMNKDRIL